MNEIGLKIQQIIKDKLGLKEPEIKDEAKFYDDLGVDSLDFIEMIVDIEQCFNIKIPDEAYGRLTTVGALVNYVEQHVYQSA